jgi:hypothetical protein
MGLVSVAHAQLPHLSRFSVVGGGNLTEAVTSQINNITYGQGLGLELGVLVEIEARSKTFSFETGMLYQKKNVTSLTSGSDVTYHENFNDLEVPLIFRARLNRVFSLGLGSYLDYGLGNINETSSNGSSNTSFSEENLVRLDYGLIGSVRYDLLSRFFVDARFHLGLENLSGATGTSFKFNAFQILLGFYFDGPLVPGFSR